ncbi:protein Wnt-8a-like isoform X1 [Sinocyclocheilus grahami]|nr:PREDICTED: protein Wnt-8a-like isoform X1 [Sinocyclocheilus grahami]
MPSSFEHSVTCLLSLPGYPYQCLCLASPQEGSIEESGVAHAAMDPCQLFSSLVMSMCCHILSTTAWSVNNFLMTGPKAYLTYTSSVQAGAQSGIEECKHQFAWDRWNCPESALQLSTHNGLRSATRETAFVHAISAAGVMYTLTKNCSMGDFDNCGCDDSKIGKMGGRGWVWGGCSDNVDFGERIAKQFVDTLENGHDSRAAVNLHNNEAGRLAVKATLKRTCKCHGVSGSCSIQTCWMQLADFRDIGTYLKIKHDQAQKLEMDKIRMRAGNSADNRGAIADTFSTVARTELLYMEDSPDYCAKNLSLGLHGTEGRECLQSGKNLSQWEKRSCRRLCHECGLKVEERRIGTVSSCNCKFHWCCTVKCETCTQTVNKYFCAKRHKNRRPHNNSRKRQHARNR